MKRSSLRGAAGLLVGLCAGCASPYDTPTLATFVHDGELLEAQVGAAWSIDLDRLNASYAAQTLTDVKREKHFTTVRTTDYVYRIQADEGGVHSLRVKPRRGRGPFPPPAFVQRGRLVGLYETGHQTWGQLYATDRDRLWLGVTLTGSLDRLEWVAPAHAIERWASVLTVADAAAEVRQLIRTKRIKAAQTLIKALGEAGSSEAVTLKAEVDEHERRVAAEALAQAKAELGRWERGPRTSDVGNQVQRLAELRRLARGWKQRGVVLPEGAARLSATTVGLKSSADREGPEVQTLIKRLLQGDIDRISDGGRAMVIEAQTWSRARTLRAKERHCDALARALKKQRSGVQAQLRREHLARARAALASDLDQAAAKNPRAAWAYRWAAKRVRAKESAQGLEQIPRFTLAWEALRTRRGLSLRALREGLAKVERMTPWLLRPQLKRNAWPTLRARAEVEASAAAKSGRAATAAALRVQIWAWSGKDRWPEPRTVRDVQLRPKLDPIGQARQGLVPYVLRFLPAPKSFTSGGSRLRPHYADRPLPRFPLVDVLGLRIGKVRTFRAAYEAVTKPPRSFRLTRQGTGHVWKAERWAGVGGVPSFAGLFGDPKLRAEGKALSAERTWLDATIKAVDAKTAALKTRRLAFKAELATFNARAKRQGGFSSNSEFQARKRQVERGRDGLEAQRTKLNALVKEYNRRRDAFNKRVTVYNDAQSQYRGKQRDQERKLTHDSLRLTLETQITAWAKGVRAKHPGPKGVREVAWMRWWFGLDPRLKGIGIEGSLEAAHGVLRARRDRVKATIFQQTGAKGVGNALARFATLLKAASLTPAQRIAELKPEAERYLGKFGLDAYFAHVMMAGRAPDLCKAVLTPKQQEEIKAKAREIMRKYREAMRKRR